MTPVSNPDNTTQELPLSLAVTDESRTTTLLESEGVQEDDKTSTVPLHRDKPRAHTGAWLTQNLWLPTEEAFRNRRRTTKLSNALITS
ncbi:hypothetical protein Taro_002544 [Colocasia esculenta]|uniref:Uncharacterized protein n=1 Tax=Colocasia esculenta TaxID=4460 RepID=A0A843TL02_COLES|nr:hypothetical protein [Colocasia esculenta]